MADKLLTGGGASANVTVVIPTVSAFAIGYASAVCALSVQGVGTLITTARATGGICTASVQGVGTLSVHPRFSGIGYVECRISVHAWVNGALKGTGQVTAVLTASAIRRVNAAGTVQAGVQGAGTLTLGPRLSGTGYVTAFLSAHASMVTVLSGLGEVRCLIAVKPDVVLAFVPTLGAWVIFESDGTDSNLVGSIGRRWQRQGETEQLVA